MARKKVTRPLPEIDLNHLLVGNPTWPQVCEFWEHGEFHQEHYLVQAIKRHLLTPEQKTTLATAGLSIEDMLNGRYGDPNHDDVVVESIFADWNKRLGGRRFGF